MSSHRSIGAWRLQGPFRKGKESYLSKDGANPEAPDPGYGWPLGSECWYFVLDGHGWHLVATGLTQASARDRAEALMTAENPGQLAG